MAGAGRDLGLGQDALETEARALVRIVRAEVVDVVEPPFERPVSELGVSDKLRIEQTKSRAHHCGDNGLVETKNGAVIRNAHVTEFGKADPAPPGWTADGLELVGFSGLGGTSSTAG